MRRRSFITASLGTVASAIGACSPGTIERDGKLYTGTALAFGTTITVTVVHADPRQAELAIEDALHTAQRIDRLMSIYADTSQVFQLNRDGVLERPDPHLLQVLRHASDLSALTRGAFDITVQPLWQVFSRAEPGQLPSPRRLAVAKSHVGWRRLSAGAERIAFLKPDMAITLNGLAQGYAADLALAAVRERGVTDALLDTGEFIARGHKPPQRPWTLGVADPRDRSALAATLRIDRCSVATSGDYEASFTPDFVHHHIFDPATGISPQELSSVTVIAPTGLQADGLSTAFMVMGARKAHALAATLPKVELMTINKRGVVWKSAAFPSAA